MYNFLLSAFKNHVKISDFTAKLIAKCCGGTRVIDVLFQKPSYFIKRTNDIINFTEKDKLIIPVNIIDHEYPKHPKSPYKIFGFYKDISINIVFFNYKAAYLLKKMQIGKTLTIGGMAKKNLDNITFVHPDIIQPEYALRNFLKPEAIYPLTSKLNNKTMTYVIDELLSQLKHIDEWIPHDLVNKYELTSFSDSLLELHGKKINFNKNKRLAIDELLANKIQLEKMDQKLNENFPSTVDKIDIFQKLKLPFSLTEDQKKAFEEIKDDMNSDKCMNRLLQGDVGSGKTVVAFMGMLLAIKRHAQAVILAPTEILATQHYETIKKFSTELNIKTDILLGSNRKKRKDQLKKISSGEIQIIIGTHAILDEQIDFQNLGFVVIDEQHRFGVEQRAKLINKCKYPNILSMSATPIPRTLLMSSYGNMKVSSIKTKPKGRQEIQTSVVSIGKIDSLLNALQNINTQIYWVCPVIEESENLTTLMDRYNNIIQYVNEKDVRILHGKMKSEEKNHIMESFKKNEFKILISTTVIEVGVDIPNANIIIIEHAERFGLAQLHQLRGRVGRGNEAAHCVLLYHYPISEIAKQRLNMMKKTNDGFLISEEDLKLRGAGDILGKQQSGFISLKFSDFATNYDDLLIANEILNFIKNKESKEIFLLCQLFNRKYDI